MLFLNSSLSTWYLKKILAFSLLYRSKQTSKCDGDTWGKYTGSIMAATKIPKW